MRAGSIIAVFVLFAGALQPLAAATYYVRKTGSDGNLGTSPSQAWLTVQKAATMATAGDTVYVGAGTYAEFVQPAFDGTLANPIKFIADTSGTFTGDAGSVIISGGALTRALELSSDDYHQWYNFKFTGGTQSAINVTGSIGGYFEGCEIYSSTSDGIVAHVSSSITVYQCTIRDNVDYGLEIIEGATVVINQCTIQRNTKGGIGAYGNAANNTTIRRCVVSDNPAHGIYIDQGTATLSNVLSRGNTQHGLHITAGTVTVWHATLAYNTLSGLSIAGGAVNLRNSICAYNSNYGMLHSAGALTHTYNCSYGNTSGGFSGTAQSTGETIADPRFWSATCLELQDGSPCYNAGTNPGGAVTDDLEGVARPAAGGYDMGCYETLSLSYANLPAAYTALNPYAWWRMNEANGNVAADQMTGHPGTYQNGVLLYQKGGPFGSVNKAAQFDGVDDKVNLGTINPTATAMSFVAWFKADDFDVTNADLMAKASGTADANYYWSLGTVNSGGLQRTQFRFRAGGSTAVAIGTGTFGPSAWVFVAGVYDGQALIVYRDGVEVGRTAKTGTPDMSTAVNAAIADNPTGTRPFDGTIDEVAIFTKALKPREIAALYASALKGSTVAGVVPKLWGVDEDDSYLFAFTNYNSHTTTLINYGRLKWNNGGTITDFGDSFNISSLAINRHGRAYFTCDSSFGTNTAPVLLSFDLSGASTTLPNVLTVVGSVPTSTELRGLAIDPLNEELYAIRSDGWLFVLSTTNGSIVRTVGQVTGMGDVVTTGEDLVFDPYGNLYVMDDADDEFYLVNKSNGAIMSVVPGGALGTIQGIAWDAVNSRILASETTTGFIVNAAANLQSASYLNGMPGLGLTDIEAIGFSPAEGRTGLYATGVRILKWKEIK